MSIASRSTLARTVLATAALLTSLAPLTLAAPAGVQGQLDDLKLDAYKGKNVMLVVWGGWCVPCWKKMPDLQTLVKGKDIELVAVVHQSDPEWTGQLAKRFNLTFPIYTDWSGFGASKRFGQELMPEFVQLIGKDGKVNKTIKGVPLDQLQVELKSLSL